MCRILGASFGSEREDLTATEIATRMFPALVGGGPHAYGWMSYNEADENDHHISWQKFVGRADTKAAHRKIKRGVDADATWFVGHTRFATHGDPRDIRNDHPIPHGNIIGVHNGVLSNHEDILRTTGREDPKTKVDSEAIFAAVNKWGPTRGLARIKGNLVAIYSDFRKPHVLHIARTHGRQLTLGFTARGNIIFASEEQALKRLTPEIEFTHFSTISENRLLILRAGKIIQRHRFAPPTPKARRELPGSPLRSWTPPRGEIRVSVSDRALQERAIARGKLLFGDRDSLDVPPAPTRRPRPVFEPVDIVAADGRTIPRRAHNQNEQLFYYDGMLLTRKEYEEFLESEGT